MLSVLPDDQVAVEAHVPDFPIAATHIVEAGDAVAHDIFESLLDARHAHVEIVAERVEQVLDALTDFLRVIAAGDAGIDADNLVFVFMQFF